MRLLEPIFCAAFHNDQPPCLGFSKRKRETTSPFGQLSTRVKKQQAAPRRIGGKTARKANRKSVGRGGGASSCFRGEPKVTLMSGAVKAALL